MSEHPNLLDGQASAFAPRMARAKRYRDLAREARVAAAQSNEDVRDPFIRVATQCEQLASELESGREASV
jgi:hypothetical protein